MEHTMELTKMEPAATGLGTAVLYTGTASVDDIALLVRDPREALAKAGADVPADQDITVRVDRSAARIAPREAGDEDGDDDDGDDEEGRADETTVVVVVVGHGGTTVIVLAPQ
jgi:hypothetical protein